jgi:hypothetical protein
MVGRLQPGDPWRRGGLELPILCTQYAVASRERLVLRRLNHQGQDGQEALSRGYYTSQAGPRQQDVNRLPYTLAHKSLRCSAIQYAVSLEGAGVGVFIVLPSAVGVGVHGSTGSYPRPRGEQTLHRCVLRSGVPCPITVTPL